MWKAQWWGSHSAHPIWGSRSAILILLSSHLLHRNHYKKSTQGKAVNDTPELKACHLSIALGKFILLKISSFVSYDVIISPLTVENWGFVCPPAIQQVTQIPMKCLVSPFSYFGAARFSLAWLKIRCPTLSQLWARKVDEKQQRDSPAFCAGLSHSLRSAPAERIAGHGQYQAALPTTDRAGCRFPSSLTASKVAPLFGHKWRCWTPFALLLEAVWVLLGRELRTEQHRKE